MKNIRFYRKWNILVYIGILCMLLACADHMLQGDGNSEANQQNQKNEELTISVAKAWFEKNYAPVITTRISSSEEWLYKPHWNEAKEYNKMQYEVVETPIYIHGSYLIMDNDTEAHWIADKKHNFIRNNARLVTLLDKKTNKTRSFITIFIGTYKYLKETRTIGKNNYLYRQPDFSGSVFFYEVNGTFINGWRYSEGKIIASLSKVTDSLKDVIPSNIATRSSEGDCVIVYYPIYGSDSNCDRGQGMDDMEFGVGGDDLFCPTVIVGYYPVEECPPLGGGDPENPNPGGSIQIGGSETGVLGEIYGDKSTLTDEEKKLLEKAIVSMNYDEFRKKVYNSLTKVGIKINFHIDPSIEGQSKGKDKSTDRTILFASKKDINSKTLEEELLYALQHLYYGEDFDDPNKKFTYEFEAHIFPDIANAILYSKIWNTPLGANIFLTDSSPDFKDAVNNLINLILKDGCFDDYQYLLFEKAGKIWKPLDYHGEFDSTIQPMILYSIFGRY